MSDFNDALGIVLGSKKPGQTETPAIPNFADLGKIVQPQPGLFGQATSAYCVATHPELYAASFYAGAGVTGAGVLVLFGVVGVISMIRRAFFGGAR